MKSVASINDILNKNIVINESKSFTYSLKILNICFFDPCLYHEPFSNLSCGKKDDADIAKKVKEIDNNVGRKNLIELNIEI